MKKRVGVSQSGIFSNLLGIAEADDAQQTSRAANIVAAADISTMLALQEISEEEIRRKKIIKHGNNMLDSLEQLRRRLLMGTLPMHILHDINQQLAIQKQDIADPQLMEIIAEIELRTAVELAKLEMATASNSIIE